MALIFINPADVAHITSGTIAFNCIQSMIISFWQLRVHLYSIVESFKQIFFDVSYVSIPSMLSYWHTRSCIAIQRTSLNLKWWIILISAIWLEPPLRKGKHHNGTYWVVPKADLFENKAQSKELARRHRRLTRNSQFAQSWNKFWFRLYAMSLNLCAVIYFVTRILRYKLGFLASKG